MCMMPWNRIISRYLAAGLESWAWLASQREVSHINIFSLLLSIYHSQTFSHDKGPNPTPGGVSFFSPSRGWACDAVVNFELVLADGTIANANATSNADLYAALKGGQNNFGIITRFDLQAFPLEGPIWGGRIAFNSSAEADLVSAFTEFKSSAYDPHAAGWVTWRYNVTTNQTTPTSILWYTKPEQKPGALKPIVETKPQLMNGMTTGTPREFAKNASMVVKTSNLK